MKTLSRRIFSRSTLSVHLASGLVLALFSILNSKLSTALAQGNLNPPPGAPAPTMKTLVQIEPRTPISSAPFTITKAGSYYLTTNVSVSTGNAITIMTNGVTLDLNGFTLSSTEASPTGTGILINFAPRDVTVFNGHIRGGVTNNSGVYMGPGFADGILGSPENTLISRISVSGCLDDGISLSGEGTTVESCTVRTVGHFGIWASTVEDSTAADCGNNAIIGNQVSNCRGESLNGIGISSDVGALNCYGQSGSSAGLSGNTVQNCWGVSTNSVGLGATTAQNSYGFSYGGTGLNVYVAQNCFGESEGSNTYGVYASYTATGCYGLSFSGTGLTALVANNCVGSGSGTAIQSTIGVACYALAGTNNIAFKYNMP